MLPASGKTTNSVFYSAIIVYWVWVERAKGLHRTIVYQSEKAFVINDVWQQEPATVDTDKYSVESEMPPLKLLSPVWNKRCMLFQMEVSNRNANVGTK